MATGAWRLRSEWGGGEAPRLLYNDLFGDPAAGGGVLEGLLMYRGIDLARLFEGSWIGLVWPYWFHELAVMDEAVVELAGSVSLLGETGSVKVRASRSVAARHEGAKIRAASRLPTGELVRALVYEGSFYRPLSLPLQIVRSRTGHGSSGSSDQIRLAFFPWSQKIAPAIVPVAERVPAQERPTTVLAGLETAPPFPLPSGWRWETPNSMISPRTAWEAWRTGGEFRRNWIEARRDGRMEYFADWKGWDLRPLLLPFLSKRVNQMGSVLGTILATEQWCRRHRIKAIVVPQDGGEAVRSLIVGAQLGGAQAFSIQYGLPMDAPEISQPLEATTFLNGEFARRIFLKRGASPDRLAVVGTTLYDRTVHLRTQRKRLRAELVGRYLLDPSKPWVVVATWQVHASYPRSVKKAELAIITRAVSKVGGTQLLFKLHPSDEGGGAIETDAASQRGMDFCIVGTLEDNESLMCAADVVICNYTTLAIMAIVARTPVLIVDVGNMQEAPDRAFVDEGVAEFADDASTAEVKLRTLLGMSRDDYWGGRSQAWRHFISERLYSDDGKAAARILETIESRI